VAAEHEDHEDQAPEHGAPPATGKHKGALSSLVTGKHRDAIIVVSSVVSVMLLWLTFRRTSDSSGSAAMTSQLGPTQAAQSGLSSGSVAGSDASALLGFQTLLANQSDQIQQINQGIQGIIGSTPDQTPSSLSSPSIAAGLFSPKGTSQWVSWGDGVTAEVESDGSLFGLAGTQIAQLRRQGVNPTIVKLSGNHPTDLYSTSNNVKMPSTSTPLQPGQVRAI